MRPFDASVIVSTAILSAACATSGGQGDSKALVIQEQGSFAVGGTVKQGADGQTLHGDHAYVFYQRPPNARKRI